MIFTVSQVRTNFNMAWIAECDDKAAAEQGIVAMADFFKTIGMPAALNDFGISANAVERLTDLCTFGGKRTINSVIELGEKEIKDIFNLCIS